MESTMIILYFIVFCMLMGLIQILSLRGKRSTEKMKEAMRANPPESFGTATKNGTPVGGEIFREGDWFVTSAKGENLPDSSFFLYGRIGKESLSPPWFIRAHRQEPATNLQHISAKSFIPWLRAGLEKCLRTPLQSQEAAGAA